MTENKMKPPKIAAWLFSIFCTDREKNTIAGDMDEYYVMLRNEEGRLKADAWYWKQVLFSLFAFMKNFSFWRIVMLKNYVKVSLRTIKRNKGYSLINILGLAVGMASCILVFLWLQHELSYDRFHKNADCLFRIDQVNANPAGEITTYRLTPPALLDTLKDNYPGIQNGARYLYREWKLKGKENTFNEIGAIVDEAFLNIFTFPLVKGDKKEVLSKPDSIVLTKELAKKIFGNANPVGERITVQDRFDFVVTGILGKIPGRSSLSFDFLVPFTFAQKVSSSFTGNWQNSFLHTYVELDSESSLSAVTQNISGLITKHVPESPSRLSLTPFLRIHLHDPDPYKLKGSGNAAYVPVFSIMAVFLLLIACINFMNLSTAQSGNRAKEVGLRKVVGAKRWNVITQFYGESLLLTFIAAVFAMGFVALFLPEFNELTGKQFGLEILSQPQNWGIVLGAAVLTGVISGFYPSLFLSSYQPIGLFKGLLKRGKKGINVRRFLVIFQFAISIVTVIGSIGIYRQLHFMQSKDLGFDRNNVLYFRLQGNLASKYSALKKELLKVPGVRNLTTTDSPPGRRESYTDNIIWEGKKLNEKVEMEVLAVDFDYVGTFSIAMAQGRFFSKEFSTDETAGIVVNEAAVKAMGMESPLGKRFAYRSEGIEGRIIGVVKDFNSRSLHYAIGPLFMIVYPDWCDTVCVKVGPENISSTVVSIENAIHQMVPDYPFDYQFLDEDLNSLYILEQRTGTFIRYVMILTVFLSCLGLLGLASYAAEKRSKEIGIRRALGSSVFSVFVLLTKDFAKWVLLANVLAWPVAYLALQKWMGRFAYKTGMSLAMFLLAGAFAVLLALITTGYHSLKCAYTRPVDALRYE
ncbi:MAG: ABC transporter permease [Candidatus Aminicenantes bacterium]|nr:ABC transporter permease [Candidatus Aminicenantes bacterium]